MPTLPENAIRLAKQLSEEARLDAEVNEAEEIAATEFPVSMVAVLPHSVPMFLHERELADAIGVITLLASGRNPFQPEHLERLTEVQQLDVLRSLAVVVCTLASSHERRPSVSIAPSIDNADASAKRPLDEYIRRVETQAILEALEEARYNRTEAALLLGITFRALRYKLESLGIDV